MPVAMAKHILVKTEKEALDILKKIETDQDFEKCAKRFSICPSKNKGGDLGEVRKGDLVKPIETVIFKKALNKIHGPVKSRFGYHLVKVYFRD